MSCKSKKLDHRVQHANIVGAIPCGCPLCGILILFSCLITYFVSLHLSILLKSYGSVLKKIGTPI